MLLTARRLGGRAGHPRAYASGEPLRALARAVPDDEVEPVGGEMLGHGRADRAEPEKADGAHAGRNWPVAAAKRERSP